MNEKLKVLNDTWYEEGLPFECTGCGKCCTGAPGYTWVSDEEIEKIAQELKISVKEMHQKYLVQVKDRYSIRDLPAQNYSCIFLKDKLCQIYKVRPKQCRTYPFWPSILDSKKNWEDEKRACEGIRDHYPKISKEEIEKRLS